MNEAAPVIRKEIQKNSEICGVRLSPALEHHLVATVSRYLAETLGNERLTVRLVHAGDADAKPAEFRKIGDDCLVCCSLFPENIMRFGGSINHYAGVGRTAYDSAGLTEAAYGFGLMLDVLSAFRKDRPVSLLDLALAGSLVARAEARNSVILPFISKPRARF